MKSSYFKKLLPHVIAIIIFIVAAAIMSKPALQSGVVLNQIDVSGWKGMAQNSFNYAAEHNGYAPLWTPSMFSGMPTYNITYSTPWTPTAFFSAVMQLGLPKPLNFFFLAAICFYIFCMCINIRPYVAIIGSLAFAYASFTPIIISAGHETQMMALAYMPAVLGSILLIYQRKYILGFALTAFFTMLEIGMNHQQISYYLLLVTGIMTISYLIIWIKQKEWAHIAKALSLSIIAGIIGLLVTAVSLLPLSDYAKYSKRGGQLILNKEKGSNENIAADGKTKGLSVAYAFQWSYGKTETFTLLFPGIYGYGSRGAELGEGSHIAQYLEEKASQSSDQALQFAQSLSRGLYWGEQPGTEGPVYLGSIVCLLFIFGMVYLKTHHKWWILTAVVLGILMSWGSHFAAFNEFLFNHLPLYNKFRVPTMTLVIPQLLFPVVVVMSLNQLLDKKDTTEWLWRSFKLTAIAMAAIFIIAVFLYMTMDYKLENRERTVKFTEMVASKSPDLNARYAELNNTYESKKDNQLFENLFQNTGGNIEITKGILNALREDRKAVFGKDILQSFIFVALGLLLLLGFVKNKINAAVLLAGIGLLTFIDLYLVGKNYLSEADFIEADQLETQAFPKTAIDEKILQDKEPNFRVFNETAGDPFQESRTSYYHNSIGGYSPAKLGIYDDLAAYQLSGNPNQRVLNMLNTKYIIRQDPQTGKPVGIENPGRLGNCWIVKGVKFAKGPAEEMTSLFSLDTKDSAVVDESFKKLFPAGIQFDSAASIKMLKFDNEKILYESNASSPQVAILSEIYYPSGWNAFIDNKPADYFKADYVLRGIIIPAGKHSIEFRFEPVSYKYGAMLSKYFSYIILILLAVAAFLGFRKAKQEAGK